MTAVVLLGLLALDVTLAVVALGFPDFWFHVFHGTPAPTDLVYFRRTGAQWAGFAVVQAIALARWRRDPRWLAAVAGVRLCDVLTDWTALACMSERTLFAWLALMTTGPANAAFAAWLFRRARPA